MLVLDRESPESPSAEAPLPHLYTFGEAMRHLRVSRSTIYRLMDRGLLTGTKVGPSWRFTRAQLEAATRVPDVRRPSGAPL